MLGKLAALSESLQRDDRNNELVKAEWHSRMKNIQHDMEEVPLCLNLWKEAQTHVSKGCPERAAAVCATIASVWPHLAPKREPKKSLGCPHLEPKSVPKPKAKRIQSRNGPQRTTSILSPVHARLSDSALHERLSDSALVETKQWATPTRRTTAIAQPGLPIGDHRPSARFTPPARRQSRSSAQNSATPTAAEIAEGKKSRQIHITSSVSGGAKEVHRQQVTTASKSSPASKIHPLPRRTHPLERPLRSTLNAFSAGGDGGKQPNTIRTGSISRIRWEKQLPPSRLSHSDVLEESPHYSDALKKASATWTTSPGSPGAWKRPLSPKGEKKSPPRTETAPPQCATRLPCKGSPLHAAASPITAASPLRKESSLQSAPPSTSKSVRRTPQAAQKQRTPSPLLEKQLLYSNLHTGPTLSAKKVAPPSPLRSAPSEHPPKRAIAPPFAEQQKRRTAGSPAAQDAVGVAARNHADAAAGRLLYHSGRPPSSPRLKDSCVQPSTEPSSSASLRGFHLASAADAGMERAQRSEYDSPSMVVGLALPVVASVPWFAEAAPPPSLPMQSVVLKQSQTTSAELSAAIVAPPIVAPQMIAGAPASTVGVVASPPTVAPAQPLPAVAAGRLPVADAEPSVTVSSLSGVTSASPANVEPLPPFPAPSMVMEQSQTIAAESSTTTAAPTLGAPQMVAVVPSSMVGTASPPLTIAPTKPASPAIAERLSMTCAGPSTTKAVVVRSLKITPRIVTPRTLAGPLPIKDTEAPSPMMHVNPSISTVAPHTTAASLPTYTVQIPTTTPAESTLSMITSPTHAAHSPLIGEEPSPRIAAPLQSTQAAPPASLPMREESVTTLVALPIVAEPLTGVGVASAHPTDAESSPTEPKPTPQRSHPRTNATCADPILNAFDVFRATVVSPAALIPSFATDAQVMADLECMMCEQPRFVVPNRSNSGGPEDAPADMIPVPMAPLQAPISATICRDSDDAPTEMASALMASLEAPIRATPCRESDDAPTETAPAPMTPLQAPISPASCREFGDADDASTDMTTALMTPSHAPVNAAPWGVPIFPETILPVRHDVGGCTVVQGDVASAALKGSRGSNIIAVVVMDIDAQGSMHGVASEELADICRVAPSQTTPNNSSGEERATATPLAGAKSDIGAADGGGLWQSSGAVNVGESLQSSGAADGGEPTGTQELETQVGTNGGQDDQLQSLARSHLVAAKQAGRRSFAAWGMGFSAKLPWRLNEQSARSAARITFAAGASEALPRPISAAHSMRSSALRRSFNWNSSLPSSLIAAHLCSSLPNPRHTAPAPSTNAPLHSTAEPTIVAQSRADLPTASLGIEARESAPRIPLPTAAAATHTAPPPLLLHRARPNFLRSGSTGNLHSGLMPRLSVVHRASMPQLPIARELLTSADAAQRSNAEQGYGRQSPAPTLNPHERLGKPWALGTPVILRNSLPAHAPRISIGSLSGNASRFVVVHPRGEREVAQRHRTPSVPVIHRCKGPVQPHLLTPAETSSHIPMPQEQPGVVAPAPSLMAAQPQMGIHCWPMGYLPCGTRVLPPASKHATAFQSSLPRTVWGQTSSRALPLLLSHQQWLQWQQQPRRSVGMPET
eukprot:GEMP01000913.1.p1 GENE.GEMP01000913.1~~GEMP01000913.1.p1  ORF type:complete len:1600 (+),score=398.33 GEMP01000913.1:214-5013(+)